LSLAVMTAGAMFAWQQLQAPETTAVAPQARVSGATAATPQPQHKAGRLEWLDRVNDVVRNASFSNVTIATVPAGATVALGGAELGTTPYRMQLKDETVVEVSLPGHETQSVTVRPDGDPNLIVKLVPLPPFLGAAQQPR
jgi:hypothetical protein